MTPRIVILCALGAVACGRSGFDPLPAAHVDASDAASASCLSASFDDEGLAAFVPMEGDWTIVPTGGPDGSPALRGGSVSMGHQTITHPALRGISEARIRLDFLTVDAASGDFVIDFMGPGWAMREDPHYAAELFPPGSDTTPDQITWESPVTVDRLGTHVSTAAAGAWHRIDVTFAVDHSMVVELAGAPHMTSAADARTSGPFDLVLHFFNEGLIDNVVVDCVR